MASKKITRKRLETFLARHATEESVLDIGAGRVATNHSYDQYFPNRHTIDIDPKREPDTLGDIHDLPFNDNSFGFILCTEVLEHCHTPQLAIDEIRRVLWAGGTAIVTTRFVFPIHDAPHDYFRFTKYGLRHLFCEWVIDEIIPETDTFSAFAALLQRIGFQSKLRGGPVSGKLLNMMTFLFDHANWLVVQEYANARKSDPDDHIMTTGYYVVARKP